MLLPTLVTLYKVVVLPLVSLTYGAVIISSSNISLTNLVFLANSKLSTSLALNTIIP